MKKLILLLILFNISTNIFANWTVINNTDGDLNVQLCIYFKPSETCGETSSILKGKNKTFFFYAGTPLKSVIVRKAGDPGSITKLDVPKEISQSSKFSIEGDAKIGYSLSAG